MKKDTYNVFNFSTNNIRKVYFGVYIGPWVEGDKKLIYCKLYAGILKCYSKLTNEKQLKDMKIMLSSISRLELLINDIFDVYKLDIGRLKLIKKSVQVTNLVKDNIPGLELLMHKKKISFNVEVIPPPGTVSVLCDPRRIGQVITNLVKNSVDFVPDKGGKITIRTERACTTQGNTGNPNYVTFTIEDIGALYFLKKLIIFSKSFTK
jgi:signal transduction histidine kinase